MKKKKQLEKSIHLTASKVGIKEWPVTTQNFIAQSILDELYTQTVKADQSTVITTQRTIEGLRAKVAHSQCYSYGTSATFALLSPSLLLNS